MATSRLQQNEQQRLNYGTKRRDANYGGGDGDNTMMTDENTDIFYPVAQIAMPVSFNCDQMAIQCLDTQRKMVCIINNSKCGSSAGSKSGGNGKSLLNGNFCENHGEGYLDQTNALVHRNGELSLEALCYKGILDDSPLPLYVLWAAQPINTSQKEYLELFSKSPNAPLDGVDNFAALLAMGSRGYKPGYADLTENERKIMMTLINYANTKMEVLKPILQCCRLNKVNLYFTRKYILENQNNGWLRKLDQYKVDEDFIGFDNNIMNRYSVPYREFNTFDLLTILSYSPSTQYACAESINHITHIPNVQIINGKFYYGTGFGLKQSLPIPQDINYSEKYPLDVMQILETRSVYHNFNVLYLDAVSYGKQPKVIGVMTKKHEDCYVIPSQDAQMLYNNNKSLLFSNE